ncbi:MAG: F0F1 ATP synthase subunit alpha [Candidatus Omnitrophica bacterium]|nr:F0F1 ATP synthase subunit alpha [Candidatus Omnitrophota bacterium]
MPAKIAFDIQETGTIHEVRKMIVRVRGLPGAAFGQPVLLPGDLRGMVIGYDEKDVMILAFNELSHVRSGDTVKTREESLLLPVGDEFLGRAVNGLAQPLDGKGGIRADGQLPVFGAAPGIMDRAAIRRPLRTGTTSVDAIIPIGLGQRELIIGDRVTGKTTLATDAVINQKDRGTLCVYCCVGRSFNFLGRLAQLFSERGAAAHTVVVGATADAPVGEQFLAPYTAASIGEYFMRKGRDVLVVFDDLTKHAWIYRQIALILNRTPGREAYPGDIFYIHSQLMERAGQLKPELGGGSMTFLPIVETQQGDVTGYIPSNLISMTDGQIYMSSELFQEGFKPAIDFSLSVSRIGNKIQSPLLKELSSTLRLDYVQYKELINVTRLRSTVSPQAAKRIRRGNAMEEILKQGKNEPASPAEEIICLYALRKGFLDRLDPLEIREFKRVIYDRLKSSHAALCAELSSESASLDKVEGSLRAVCEEYFGHSDSVAGSESG